jgi:hypothetical protein
LVQKPKEKGQRDKQYNSPKKKEKRTNNTTAQRKRTKGQTIQQTKEKGQKDKQYNSPKKKDKRTNNVVLCVPLSFLFGLLYYLSFFPFSLSCCIVCPFVLFL